MVTPCGPESNDHPGDSNRRGLGRDVAWTYVPPLAAALSSLVLLGYSLREIGTADYGLFAVLSSVIALVTMLDYSLSTSVVRSTVMHATAATSAARDTAKHEVAVAHSALMALGAGLAALGLPIAYVLPAVINVPPGRESALFICTLLLSLAAGISLATAALPGAARGYRGCRAVALSAPIVIGSLTTASAVAAYRVGAVLPTQALLLLETAWTAIFPRLAVESSSAADGVALIRLATRVLSYVGGVGFGVIALFRRDLVQLVLGHPDSLASM